MSEYYRRALRQMDINRTEKIAEARARSEAFYAAHPQLDTLQKDIAAVTREGFVAMRKGELSADALEDFSKKRIAQIRKAHEDAIRALGVDPASLSPRWDCPACEDTGYIATEDGNRKMCTCLKQLAAALALVAPEYRPDPAITFEAFDLTRFPAQPDPVSNEKYSQRALMEKVLEICKNYAENFERKKAGNMVLVGDSGLGKTYLAHCIANKVAEKGFSVCFLTAYNLSNLMRGAYLGESHDVEMEQALLSCDLLVIDDLGSEPIRKNINLESLFSLLNERGIAKRPVLVCSNLLNTSMRDRYGERITSRLMADNATILRLYGSDVRHMK